MAANNAAAHEPDFRELVITRTFNAPWERVFRAWTDSAEMMRWWGPRAYTTPFCRMDLHVGGKYLCCMRSAEGQDVWSTGVYREIVAPERLVMTDSFADALGNVVPASHYGMTGEMPLEMQVTVSFDEHQGATTMVLRHHGFPAGEMLEGARSGWNESFDKLAEFLSRADQGKMVVTCITAVPNEPVVRIECLLNAPRERVWQIVTDPKLVPQWWGPARFATTVNKMEVRPGGEWRYIQQDTEGNTYGFHGVYREVVQPSRLVYTFEFEGMPGHVSTEHMTFEDVNGTTQVTNEVRFDNIADRDGMLRAGMESGTIETMNRLGQLLAVSLRRAA